MAQAKARCTCKYCGNEFTKIKTCGNRREADSWESWAADHYDECPECEAKRLEAANREAIERSADKGWPELTGSEKQINWANSIREELIEKISNEQTVPGMEWLRDETIRQIIAMQTKAAWWIDNRVYARFYEDFVALGNEIYKAHEESEKQEETAHIAEPEHKEHESAADIAISDSRVAASYAKDDDFIRVVKALGYKWDADARVWTLKISEATGTARERAAELGNKLLNAGFAIRMQDDQALADAIAGNYEPLSPRYILGSEDGKEYLLVWPYGDDLYKQATSLPGARYRRPYVRVPDKEYAALLDFAHAYDFRVTPSALAIVERMRAATVTVTPAAVPGEKEE